MTETSTWEAPRGPGPTKLVGGIPLLAVGLLLVLMLPPSLESGDFSGSESIGRWVVLAGLGGIVLGVLLSIAGARTALWRRSVRRHGVRAEGEVVARKTTTVKTSEHGGHVVKLTVRLDEPGGPEQVVVREISGAEVGRRVVVRYDADRPGRAVLMGKAPIVRDVDALAAQSMAQMAALVQQGRVFGLRD